MNRPLRRACLALAILAFAAPAARAQQGEGKKSAFGPDEQTLQLPPLWVPVEGLRSRTKGVAGYRPVTLRLTSRAGGALAMCHRLPYLTEAFLFALTREPVSIGKAGALNFGNAETRLLNEAARVAGPETVKRVEAIDGAPHPTKTNQELLALCQ